MKFYQNIYFFANFVYLFYFCCNHEFLSIWRVTINVSSLFHVLVIKQNQKSFRAALRLCVSNQCITYGSYNLFREYQLVHHYLRSVLRSGVPTITEVVGRENDWVRATMERYGLVYSEWGKPLHHKGGNLISPGTIYFSDNLTWRCCNI